MTKYLFMLLSVLVFNFALFAREGAISITSNPSECWVRVDSVLVGQTPLKSFELEEGEHLVQVFPPNKGVWNLEARVFEVFIKSNRDTTINVVFSSPVYINSVPYGAELFSGTIHLGFTPLYIPFEENFGKSFRLEKKGYKPYAFKLTSNNSIIATLERGNDFVDENEKPRLLGFLPKRHLKSKFTLLAISIASHWASFYFKNVADDNYQKYTQTADPQLMDQHWKQTQKYDRLSEISLGVSFASLAGLIYFVIWK
jgi:hypothetical protein